MVVRKVMIWNIIRILFFRFFFIFGILSESVSPIYSFATLKEDEYRKDN